MEARRKEEEARRLRQEEEDRKAALALQVMDSRLLNHFSTFILELLLIIPKHRPSWKRKPRRTSSTASSWSRNGATTSWPSGWPKNPTARSRTAHRCWESMYLVFVWSEFFFLFLCCSIQLCKLYMSLSVVSDFSIFSSRSFFFILKSTGLQFSMIYL